MSIPEFPVTDPSLTREHALHMILASIAMEELALGHIVDAEGEKLQYVLAALEERCGEASDLDKILAINQSAACLLDSVFQNQLILKNKMDKALCALSHMQPPGPPGPPWPPGPPGPPCPPDRCRRCSAVFGTEERCRIWRAGSAFRWSETRLSGPCATLDPQKGVFLCAGKRYMIGFSVTAATESCSCSEAAVKLLLSGEQHRTCLSTVRADVSEDCFHTITAGNIIAEADCHGSTVLSLCLVSPESLVVSDAMLSVLAL